MFIFSNGFLNAKRYISLFLSFLLSIGYFLGLDVSLEGVRNNKESKIFCSFYEPTRKIRINEYLEKNKDYDIYLARNELEGCQFVIGSSSKSSKRYSVEFTPFKNENGDVLKSSAYEEQYITCISDKNYGTFPDALSPVNANKQYVFKQNVNYPFYIEVNATKDTPAGKYTSQIIVRNLEQDGRVDVIGNVSATVWDFELPETPTMDTAFGLNRTYISRAYGVANNSEFAQGMYEKYYEYMLQHKISPYSIPVDILSSEADAYMSDPRVKSFIIPYPGNDAKLQEYYQKVKSNPDWAEKGYFYPIDEPWNLEDYARYNAITDRLERLCPGFNMVTPFGGLNFKENNQTYYGIELQNKSNIVCPISTNFSDKTFLSQVDERRADGSKIWWYICCAPSPNKKYANIFTISEGIEGRILMWQQKNLNITGLLYWDTAYWNDVSSPWASAWTTPWTGVDTFGDGSLLYPGANGPVASLRLKYVSDGIEDFEYLTISEEIFGKDYVNKKIAKVSKNLTNYTYDDSLLAKVRIEIGNDIQEKLSK